MKIFIIPFVFALATCVSATLSAQQSNEQSDKSLYIDVHHLGAGNVNQKAVAAAHKKDLAVQKKYGVSIIRYWLDEAKGDVYCLASASSPDSLVKTHADAHGLLPSEVYQVTSGNEEALKNGKNLFLDVHQFEPGKVSAKDVAGAHQKDLAVEKKYGVHLINYWVDEKAGVVMCLAQAPDSTALIKTHAEAHGLLPVKVMKVQQGQ